MNVEETPGNQIWLVGLVVSEDYMNVAKKNSCLGK